MINKTKPTNQNRHGRNGKWTTQNLKQYENAKISRLQYLQNKAPTTQNKEQYNKNDLTQVLYYRMAYFTEVIYVNHRILITWKRYLLK